MTRRMVRGAELFLFVVMFATVLPGGTIVLPGSLVTTDGGSSFGLPAGHGQQVFNNSLFTGLGTTTITGLALRPDADNDQAGPFTTNLTISLSTTTRIADGNTTLGLSSNFNNNIGADAVTVFNQSIALSTANVAGSGTANEFDVVVNFTTPFVYDVTAGANLLVDFINSSAVPIQFDTTGSVIGDGTSQNLGILRPTGGYVMKFLYADPAPPTSPVPEPSACALLGSGLAGLLLQRFRKKA